MMSSRKIAAIAVGLGFLGAVPTPALAAGDVTSGRAGVWAAFQQPAPWEDQADNLHWYVSSPTFTAAAIGKKVSIQATLPKSVDCRNLGSGYEAAGEWVNVDPDSSSCSAGRVVRTFTVSKAMVGSSIAVIGWSTTTAASTQVQGVVRIAGRVQTVRVSATRSGDSAPVGPLTKLGTFGGKPVYFSTENTVNEIWIGKAKRYAAPTGAYLHVGLDGEFVELLLAGDGSTVNLWRLDLLTGQAETKSIPANEVREIGEKGFVVYVKESLELKVYNYAGRSITQQSYRLGQMLGFAGDFYARIGYGMTPAVAYLFPMDGSDPKSLYCGGIITRVSLDRESQTISFMANTGSADVKGELSPTKAVCTPIPSA